MKKLILIIPILIIISVQGLSQESNSSIIIKPKPSEQTTIAIPDFQPKAGNTDPSIMDYLKIINKTLWDDLYYSSFFKLISKSFYPANHISEPEDIDFKEWKTLGMNIDYIVIGNARIESNYLIVQCRVYDVKTEEQVIGKQFRTIPRYARAIAHRIADKIVTMLSAKTSLGIASTHILFEKKTPTGKEIYVADYDGEDARPLTSNGSINVTPAWHPNNDTICYTSYSMGTPLLYYLSLSSGETKLFPVKGGLITTPAFSADGKLIAFSARLPGTSDTDIYISNIDGTNRRNITQHPGIDISPCWSPTDKQLAFVSNRSGLPQIYICDAWGANIERITVEKGYATSPAWSPDGRYIAFSWRPSIMSHFDIYIIEVATKKILQLTHDAGDNENPSWAPDGRHIVFQSDRTGENEIFLMFSDGTHVKQITHFQGCSNPAWSGYNKEN